MTDHDRDMRTLVLCFVLAIMALLPLRIVEFGQNMVDVSSTQVLGETIQQEEVVLPNAEIQETEVLNARYIGR